MFVHINFRIEIIGGKRIANEEPTANEKIIIALIIMFVPALILKAIFMIINALY